MTLNIPIQSVDQDPALGTLVTKRLNKPAGIRQLVGFGSRATQTLSAATLVFLAFATTNAADEPASRSASEQFTRIVGGLQSEAGKWPWSVALILPDKPSGARQQFCGGSVVAPRWVLTAAHCVDSFTADRIQVLVGTHDLERGGRRVDVRAIHSHEGYSDFSTENDIALLELARPARVPAVTLPDTDRVASIATPDTTATAIGWGLLRPLRCEPGTNPNAFECDARGGVAGHFVDDLTGRPVQESDVLTSRLMEVELPLVDERTCLAAYPGAAIDERTLCAGLRRGGKDSCQGDSGGPLVVRDGDAWVQTGVVSWGHGCAKPGKYGVYTNVGAFAHWVEARTGLALAQSNVVDVPQDPTPPDEPLEEEVATSTTEPEPPPPAEPASATAPKGDRALIIGIDLYADARIQDLRGAVRDSRNMRRLLSEHLGFEPEGIRTLINNEATREAILTEIDNWLVNGTHPGARALLYYAGHGYFQLDDDGDEQDGFDEVLVPQDARIVSGETRPMHVANLIRDDEVGALLDELRDREAYLIIDSCHSGTMTRSAAAAKADQRYVRTLLGPDSRDFGRRDALELPFTRSAAAARQRDAGFIESNGNLVAWSAVSPLQLALEDREADELQGVFTRRFVRGIAEGLADRDGDGRVIHAELLDYLRAESAAYCTRHPRDCEAGLTPLLEASRDLLISEVATGEALGEEAQASAEGTLSHSNTAGVRLEIRPSARIRIGEEVTYRVQSARSGHLLIVDVASDGKVTQLFPNRFSELAGQGASIVAGRNIEIPNAYYGFRIEAGPPAGRGYLFAVVTEDPVSLGDLLDPNRDLRPVSNAHDWLLALGERLREPWLEETGTREALWSATAIEYEILP